MTGAHRRIHSDRNLHVHRNLRNGNGHQHIQIDEKSTIVRSNQTNGNHPARSTVTLVPPDASPVLRDKSRLSRPACPGRRRTRGHKSLGDLQDLILYKVRDVTNKKQMTRKSDGKEYRVRREYVFWEPFSVVPDKCLDCGDNQIIVKWTKSGSADKQGAHRLY